jgi:hypothetical protein
MNRDRERDGSLARFQEPIRALYEWLAHVFGERNLTSPKRGIVPNEAENGLSKLTPGKIPPVPS